MTRSDRRVERTRGRLQHALIELIRERGYDSITIQDIADRANVGRTTFYLHYNSKEDLFLNCHGAMVRELQIDPFHPLSREELLSSDAPPRMAEVYEHLAEARTPLYSIFQSKDNLGILRHIRNWNADQIAANLRASFDEADSDIPFDILANYLAGAQIALLQWWLEKRQPHTLDEVAQTFHRLQRAAIREAFGLSS